MPLDIFVPYETILPIHLANRQTLLTTMNTKVTLATIAMVGLSALTLQTCSAQAPTGSITNLIVGTSNVLWDLSLVQQLQHIDLEIESISHGNTNQVEILFDDPFTQDAKGKLAGTGTTSVDIDGGSSSGLSYLTTGLLSGTKGVARLAFSGKVTGLAFVGGLFRNVSASGNYQVKLDANTGQMSGRVSQKASASGLGGISGTRTFTNPIPSELGDGSWTLVLNFAAPGINTNRLSGTATVTLQTGLTYPYAFTGTYNPRTGKSKLNLKGQDTGLGSSLQVTLQGTDISQIIGRVGGQSVNLKQ